MRPRLGGLAIAPVHERMKKTIAAEEETDEQFHYHIT